MTFLSRQIFYINSVFKIFTSTFTYLHNSDPDAQVSDTAVGSYSEFGKYVQECIPKYILKYEVTQSNELELFSVPEAILPVLSFLKHHHKSQYAILTDITVIDFSEKPIRYELIYNLLSLKFNNRLRLKIDLEKGNQIDSTTKLYKSGDIYERQIYRSYNIIFKNHPCLEKHPNQFSFL